MEKLKKLSPEEMAALKEKAIAYYARNGVPKKMEEALNQMFYDSPADVFGYLVSYFKKGCSPASLESICCKPAISTSGEISTELQLHGKFANIPQLYASVIMYPFSTLEAACDHTAEHAAALNFVNEQVRSYISGNNILGIMFKSGAFDKFITDHFRNKEREVEEEWRKVKMAEQLTAPSESTVTAPETNRKGAKIKTATKRPAQLLNEAPPRPPGVSVVSSLSRLLCIGAARSVDIAPFEIIQELFTNSLSQKKRNVIPLSVLSQNGKAASGKLKCFKESFLIFNPSRSPEMNLMDTARVYEAFKLKAFPKGPFGPLAPSRLVSDSGTLAIPMDRPEQLLDLMQEACMDCGLKPGADVLFGVNCAAHDIFDQDKGKYELVIGAGKAPDDAADFWFDLVLRYPIAMLIDPLRKEDALSWQRLGERIAGKCYLFADHALGIRLDHLALGELPSVDRPPSNIGSDQPLVTDQLPPQVVKQPALPSRRPSTGGTAITLGTVLSNLPPIAPIPPCASGVVLRMDGTSLMTVSAAAKLTEYLRENNLMLMTAACPTDGSDTFSLDLALGLGAHSLLIGGVGRSERAAVVNKWLSYTSSYELTYPSFHHIIPNERISSFADSRT